MCKNMKLKLTVDKIKFCIYFRNSFYFKIVMNLGLKSLVKFMVIKYIFE